MSCLPERGAVLDAQALLLEQSDMLSYLVNHMPC